MLTLENIMERKNKLVKHFKGGIYEIVDIAIDTESGQDMVVYRALYGECELYVRPLDMFIEKCTDEQFTLYGQAYRFMNIVL